MSTNKINIEAVNARAREEQTPMSPETMQREEREGFAEGCTPMNISDPPSDHEWINTFLDQHTANVWMAAQKASQKRIEELEEEVEDLVMEIKEAGEYE